MGCVRATGCSERRFGTGFGPMAAEKPTSSRRSTCRNQGLAHGCLLLPSPPLHKPVCGGVFSQRCSSFGSAWRLARCFRRPAGNFPRWREVPFGSQFVRRGPVGETPTGATGTVALPISTASLRIGCVRIGLLLGQCRNCGSRRGSIRSPKRDGMSPPDWPERRTNSARFWTAPVFWRYRTRDDLRKRRRTGAVQDAAAPFLAPCSIRPFVGRF